MSEPSTRGAPATAVDSDPAMGRLPVTATSSNKSESETTKMDATEPIGIGILTAPAKPAGPGPAPTAATQILTAPTTAPAAQPSRPGFKDRLEGRVLVVTGDDAESYDDLISRSLSGLIVGGKSAPQTVRRLAARDSDRVIAVDPWQSYTAYATETEPFVLDLGDDLQGTLFGAPTLDEHLNAQIALGATFAVTPTGVIQAGDTRPLKAAVKAMMQLDRDDTVFHVPLCLACLNADNLNSVTGILARCPHPVAISLADRNLDPYSKVLPALRQLVAALPYVIAWRTDLAGIDLMARAGAKAAGIGVIPAKRAADTPGEKRFAIDRRDMYPHVLRPELLRYVKTSYMVDNWYASIHSPTCLCTVCQGRHVDRYGTDDPSRLEAHRHNVAALMEIAEAAPGIVGAAGWWSGLVADAVAEHTALGAAIGGRVKVPASLEALGR